MVVNGRKCLGFSQEGGRDFWNRQIAWFHAFSWPRKPRSTGVGANAVVVGVDEFDASKAIDCGGKIKPEDGHEWGATGTLHE